VKGKLIITADDYGMCPSVNRAIEECLSAGTVRATCVMANMPELGDAAALRQKFGGASIGIHWNLTQGRPVLASRQVRSLIKEDGSFLSCSELKRSWLAGLIRSTEVQAELRAQFDKLKEIVGQPDFWNTHENTHVFPGLFRVFVEMGKELNMPVMRCHRRITRPRGAGEMRYHLSHPQYWVKGRLIAWWSSRAEKLGALMPDARLYAPGYGNPDVMIQEVITRVPWGRIKSAVEIVIHPAINIEADLFGSLTESRLLEYSTFKNPELAHDLRRKGVEPVGFEALFNA
jgi:predicted glycoside hydrolase/deacetylase ChbG (UPF0249 family)